MLQRFALIAAKAQVLMLLLPYICHGSTIPRLT